MDRQTVNGYCATFPGAEVSAPFGPGHDIWKIGGKIFAAIGAEGRGVSVRCPDVETAEMLRDTSVCQKAPYFHRSWVLVPFATAEAGEIRHRIQVSYRVIRGSLPKKVQAALPAD
ncbi:MmcQ/YjbR family DNA-binding protein [Tropicimonas sp.]